MDYFLSKKGVLQGDWRIDVKGYPVEIFVEDESQKNAPNSGAYSIAHDKWIKKPQKEEEVINKTEVAKEVESMLASLHNAINTMDSKEVISTTEDIYSKRKESLAKEGEFNATNIAFKILRNNNVFKYIKDKVSDMQSKELSLNEEKEM